MEDDTIERFRLTIMKQKKTRLFLLTLLAAASSFFLIESGILPGIDKNTDEGRSFRILGTAISLIRNDYVEEPIPGQTMEGAYKGLVNSLDRMSGYLTPETAKNYIEDRKQAIPDTGIILYKNYGTLPVVTGIREDSSAEEKGIKVGDSIGAINGESTLHMSMIEANLKLKSIQPDEIHLKLIQAEENREIKLETRLIPGPPIVLEEETGTSEAGKDGGRFKPTGAVPTFLEEIRTRGLSLEQGIFDPQKYT